MPIGLLSGNQIVVHDKLITQVYPFVCNELFHCVFLQIKIFTSKSIPLSLNSVLLKFCPYLVLVSLIYK